MSDRAVPSTSPRFAAAIAVLKIGGSVLTGRAGYTTAAGYLRQRLTAAPGERLVVVVSAEYGHTDRLRDEATGVAGPAAPDPALLDLLWSTGETRSVALLALALRAEGLDACGLNVHETGLRRRGAARQVQVERRVLRRALRRHSVVVVPGFLATERQRIVTLGRGGSDWSAVLLAAALGAARCELLKDVDGYFTADPARDPAATLLPQLSYRDALAMADLGCPLVQRAAIAEAARARLPLVIRSLASPGTRVQETVHGVCDESDSLPAALRSGHRGGDPAHLPDVDVRADGAW